VLRIFIALKIHLPWPDLNPRTLDLLASIITTRLPRAIKRDCVMACITLFFVQDPLREARGFIYIRFEKRMDRGTVLEVGRAPLSVWS
jgi:hypothetical protein